MLPRLVSRIQRRIRRVYFFGYGADSEPDLITAITGRKPRVVGKAILNGYQLRVQAIEDITTRGINPRKILYGSWGKQFSSYVIVPKDDAAVSGTLYRISLHDRHLIDDWEMVGEGWYDKAFVNVQLESGRIIVAETQVLSAGQNIGSLVDGLSYSPWLQPKSKFIRVASRLRLQEI